MWLSIKHFQISKNKLGLLNGFSYKINFLPLARFFILARVLVFLANRDKKYIDPKGIFRTGKFTF